LTQNNVTVPSFCAVLQMEMSLLICQFSDFQSGAVTIFILLGHGTTLQSAGHFQTRKGTYIQGSKCPTLLCYCQPKKMRPHPHHPAMRHHISDEGRLHLQCFNCESSLSQTIYVYIQEHKRSSSSLSMLHNVMANI
jgi:hypothetical protein